ncbi:hypothetical protein V6N12_048670 [Hibiscus sabdariffa]|uniref:Uncharacterized protein n=1 Tax=Hibiscus sabdariffa TaxID=183260 RepID=A0ABR2EIC7_9ROSI
MNGLSQLNHADLLAWNGAVGSTSPPRGGHVLPMEPWGPPRHLENMATSRWRGGPHGSIPCKQIGVVELAQAIHAVSGPGHLEVARASRLRLAELRLGVRD